MIRELKSIPADVDTIIAQHHERPDGSGFPRQMDSSNIAPLACVFIVAEEFINNLYEYGFDKEDRDVVIDKMKYKYNKGNFKKALEALVASISN